MKLHAPPQLSFDFTRSPNADRSTEAPGNSASSVTAHVSRVIDLSAALRQKQSDYTDSLYQRILDSVRHLV